MSPLPYGELTSVLTDHFDIAEGADFLARYARGSLGRALDYVRDDYMVYKNGVVSSFMQDGEADYFLSLLFSNAQEVDKVLHVLTSFLHDVLLVKSSVSTEFVTHRDLIDEIVGYSTRMNMDEVTSMLQLFEDSRQALKRNASVKLILTRLAGRSDLVFC